MTVEVELHDGTVLELPDGTTPQVAQAAARKYMQRVGTGSGAAAPAPVAPTPTARAPERPEGLVTPESSRLDKLRYGVANAGIETYLGAKQLFGKLSPEEINVLQQSRGDVDRGGGWGTAGQIAGHVGVAAAGALAAPARLAQAVGALRGIPGLAAGAGVSGAETAALTPVEDQDSIVSGKLAEGGKAALTQGALSAGGQVLKKAVTRMFTPSADAVKLMDQGVYPTLQQGAESRVGQTIGGLASGSKAVPRRQAQEVLDAVTSRATGGQATLPGGTLNERLGVVNDVLDKDYGAVLGNKKFPMTASIRRGAVAAAQGVEQPGGRFAQEAAEAASTVHNVMGDSTNGVRMGHEKLVKDYLDALQQTITDGTPQRVQQGIIAAKNLVLQQSRNSQLTPDELAVMKDIDSRYFDLMRLKDAAAGSAGHEEGVPIRKLAEAYARGPGMDQIGARNATSDELVGPAYRMLGKTESENAARGTLLNWRRMAGLGTLGTGAALTGLVGPTAAALSPLYATSIAGQTKAGARALFGDYDWQKALRAGLDSAPTGQLTMANMLRGVRDSNQLGYVLTPGE